MLMELLGWKPKENARSQFKDDAHRKCDFKKGNFYFTDCLPFGNLFSATPNKPLENCRRYKLRRSRLSKEIFVIM
jgi:hypothetical protein